VDPEGTPDGRDEDGVAPSLPEALAGLDAEVRRAVTEFVVLHRQFPAWAVWLPHQGRQWIALRPASARVPAPDLPMIWVQAATAADLARRMRAAEHQLSPGAWP
jgi:hypothetical protein